MSAAAVRILVTRTLPGDAAAMARARLAARSVDAEIVVNTHDRRLEPQELRSMIAGAHGVLTTPRDRVDATVLDAAGDSLRVVSNYATGTDNIDLAACAARGVRVGNTPDAVVEPTADIAWLLILGAARRAFEGERLVRGGAWRGVAPSELLGVRLLRKTLLVVGAGKIGLATARRALGWSMRILYVARSRHAEFELPPIGAERVELDAGLAVADVVTLHTPLTPQTRHLIDARRLALMKASAILVNTARGAVIDEVALVDSLRRGHPRAVGLDVFEHEPALAPGLVELPNVFLLPHLGSATEEDRAWMTEQAVENLVAGVLGEPLSREAIPA